MADQRSFPDVDFVATDTSVIVNEMVAKYEEEYGRSLSKADPIYQLILWIAAIISQERSLLNIAVKRNLPRYAEGEYLDSVCEYFFGVERQSAAPASAIFRFSVGEALESAIIIPEGTEITTDGTVVFATNEEAEIAAGETYVDVEAECETEGTIGNGFAIGEINTLVSDIPFVESVQNTTASANGADEETDDELYQRGRESYEGYSTAGTAGAYLYHIKEHNAEIKDAVVYELDPGQVGATILMDSGIPSETVVSEMQDYLRSDEIRPLGDEVIVSAPTGVSFGVELTWYGPAGSETAEAVAEAVESYIEWQTGKLGRRINPDKLTAALIRAGADWVNITAPTSQALESTECAILSGTPEITYGGEDT